MAWTEVHQGLPTHKKTYHLAALLAIKPYVVVGHLVCLWLWSLNNTEDGSLPNIPESVIAQAAHWPKNATVFVNALIESHWMDVNDMGVMVLHDWLDYCGRYVTKLRTDRERKRAEREKHRLTAEMEVMSHSDSGKVKCPPDIRWTSARRRGGVAPTVPTNHTLPTNNTNVVPRKRGLGGKQKTVGAGGAGMNIFDLYENVVGPMNSIISEELKDAEKTYPADWIADAFKEAVDQNARRWAYIRAILERWTREGRGSSSAALKGKAQGKQRGPRVVHVDESPAAWIGEGPAAVQAYSIEHRVSMKKAKIALGLLPAEKAEVQV